MTSSPGGTGAAVEVTGLVVIRGGNVVLDEVSLAVPAREATALIGPSGCGKSTLMRAIVGVQRIARGEVAVLGEPAGAASLRRRVAYTTQAPSAYRELSVRDDLRYFARIVGASAGKVDAVLGELDLLEFAARRCGELSGGQLHRVSLAAALLGDPELLVLDEPTVGVDPVLRERLWNLFRRLVAGGKTIVISSHVMEEAEQCENVILLRDGRVLAAGSPAALKEETGTESIGAAFIKLVGRREGGR